MAQLGDRKDNEQASFALDKNTDVARRVIDAETHDLLGDVIAALGGSTNTSVSQQQINIPLKNTQTTISLPADTKGFLIQSINDGKLSVTFTNGATQTGPKWTVWPGSLREGTCNEDVRNHGYSKREGDSLLSG